MCAVISISNASFYAVVAFSSKSGGKTGKHCDITESSSIGAVSNIGVQLFQYLGHAHEFCSSTDSTLMFHTKHFLLIPSFQFLCLLDMKIPAAHSQPWIELLNTDMERFRALEKGKKELMDALKCSRKRGMSY